CEGVAGGGHGVEEAACVGAAVGGPDGDLVAGGDHVVDVGGHVGGGGEEDPVGIDGAALVGGGSREDLVLDEVVGQPGLGVVEVLVAEHLPCEGGDGFLV